MIISATRMNNLAFADAIDLIDTDEQSLEETTQTLNEESKSLAMNLEKTKTLVFGERAHIKKATT